jgi:hypothetical protein
VEVNLNNKIQNTNKLNWIPHVERMEPEGIPEQVIDYMPTGTRSIGRPMLRWKDQGNGKSSKGSDLDSDGDNDI